MPTNMTLSKKILIIGGGPAGIQAALAVAEQGQQATLVSDGPPGGRAAQRTLLPSKIWLDTPPPADLAAMRRRYDALAGAWQQQMQDSLERAGVTLVSGQAAFVSPHAVEVHRTAGGDAESIEADAIILATGALPFLPPGLQADSERIFAPGLVWQIPALPKTMLVIGAGGPATEYVDAFSRLGIQVTWITGPMAALSGYPPEVGHFITQVMERRGVRLVTGLLARQVERCAAGVRAITADGGTQEAEMAFIAVGMRPDLSRLNLSAAGLRAGSSGALPTDAFGRTAVSHIYLVGDASSPLSANISAAQGRAAGQHAAGLEIEPVRVDLAVKAIYTHPQIAMVGRLSDPSGQMRKARLPFNACLRAHLMPDPLPPDDAGFIEIAYDPSGRVTGALAVCPEASELITPIAVGLHCGLTLHALAAAVPAHPTFSELAVIAARSAK